MSTNFNNIDSTIVQGFNQATFLEKMTEQEEQKRNLECLASTNEHDLNLYKKNSFHRGYSAITVRYIQGRCHIEMHSKQFIGRYVEKMAVYLQDQDCGYLSSRRITVEKSRVCKIICLCKLSTSKLQLGVERLGDFYDVKRADQAMDQREKHEISGRCFSQR